MTQNTMERGRNAHDDWLVQLFYHQLAGNLEVVGAIGDWVVLSRKTTNPKPIPKLPIDKAFDKLKKPKGGK